MSLTYDVKHIVETLYPTATYDLISTFMANVDTFCFERSDFPYIFLNNLIVVDGEIKHNANLLENNKLNMFFFTPAEKGSTDMQNEVLVDEMRDIARRVAVNIYRVPRVRLNRSENQKYKIYTRLHWFTTNLVGCELEMYVKENTTVNFCKV